MLNLILLLVSFFLCVVVRAGIQYIGFGSSGLSLLKQPSQAIIFFGLAAVFALNAATYDEITPLQAGFGSVYYILGVIGTFVGQLQMGHSWQVGIDKNSKKELVDTGLFSITRNPIYLSLIVILVGYVILAPTILSLILFCISVYIVNRQIGKEEKYLTEVHGEEYTNYKSRVPRWL